MSIISHERLQASVRRLRWLSLALAVVSIVALLSPGFYFGGPAIGTLRDALVLGLKGLSSWCWILAIVGFGMQHLDFGTPFVKYANEGVLPFYILHQTVLLCVGYLMVQRAIPDLLKWVIILLASFAIIMALYEFLVWCFNVLRLLFGMKPLIKPPVTQPGEALVTR